MHAQCPREGYQYPTRIFHYSNNGDAYKENMSSSSYGRGHSSNGTDIRIPRVGPYSDHVGFYRGGDIFGLRDQAPVEKKKVTTQKDIVHKFASRSSLQGINYVREVKHPLRRGFWYVVFFAALAAGISQTYTVIHLYYQYGTVTSITMSYENLAFPSVTFCNMNAVRKSAVNNLPDVIQNFIETNQPNSDFEVAPENAGMANNRPRREAEPDPPPLPPPHKTTVSQPIGGTFGQPSFTRPSGPPGRPPPFDFNDERYNRRPRVPSSNSFGFGESDPHQDRLDIFKLLIGNLPREMRIHVGHDINKMLLSCSFNSLVCSASNFSTYLSDDYGNCYTFNNPMMRTEPLKSLQEGAKHGLNMVLYIQDKEYLTGITSARGARIAIHPFGTYPDIAQRAYGIPPGFLTYMDMKLTKVTRLGGKYSKCGDVDGYSAYLNHTYNLAGCVSTCFDRKIYNNCDCYRTDATENYPLWLRNSTQPCSAVNESAECIHESYEAMTAEGGASAACKCHPGCSEEYYSTSLSFNKWPHPGYLFYYVDLACQRVSQEECSYLQSSHTPDEHERLLSTNFAFVRIFYEDLMFQTVAETEEYGLENFLSDVGGTFGLWTGASFITFIEIFDFLAHIGVTSCRRKRDENDHKQ